MAYLISEASATSTARSSPRTDARGCAIGSDSAEARDRVESALESMLSYFGDPLAALDAATEADPDWVYPRVLKASLLLTMTEHGATEEARRILASVSARTACERERMHLDAACVGASGDWDGACRRWEAILVEHPRDVAALLFAHLFDFYRGDLLNLRRRPERVLPEWSADLPLFGYVLGMHAFGLEEGGQYGAAEETGRRALEHNRRDPWAVHAVVHVLEMQGRHLEGSHWLSSRAPDWSVDNGFAFHNWFHAALFELERMETQAALALYDAHLARATDTDLQRLDGVAILWRLKLLGVDVQQRMAALAAHWAQRSPERGFYVFNDLHALLALAGSGSSGGAATVLDALAEARSGGVSNRRMVGTFGGRVAQGMADHARGNYRAACDALLASRDAAQGFGGSHAQRDLLTLTLIDAAIRGGDAPLARHILNERGTTKRDTPLTRHLASRVLAI